MALSSTELIAGFSPEFRERLDGYPMLKKTYNLNFKELKELDPSLTYKALFRGEIDLIDGFSTDGRISAYNLISLKDNKGFFPPYYAAPVTSQNILRVYPEIVKALAPLSYLIDNSSMMRLNFEVDKNKRDVKEVVLEFLITRSILKNS